MSSNKTNPRLASLIADLKTAARNGGGDVWGDIAERLEKPRRSHAEVNLGRIDRYAQPEETIVVPGKVLGSGALRTDVTVAAVNFSGTAETKIDAAGEAITLEEALDRNHEGANVRVIR